MIEHSPRNASRLALCRRLTAVVGLTVLLAPAALAHGPEIKISYGRVLPKTLTVSVGEVVHFHNVNAAPNPVTIVAGDGSFESPTLARGEGWHHSFETPGSYSFEVAEFSSARGTIIVAEP